MSASDLHSAYMAAIEHCAGLGMFAPGLVDERAYPEAAAQRDQVRAAWLAAREREGRVGA